MMRKGLNRSYEKIITKPPLATAFLGMNLTVPCLLGGGKHQKIEIMFGLFKKDPIKQMEKEYEKMMEEAMQIQRGGDIKAYALKVAEAEELLKKIEAMRAEKKK